MLPFLMPLLAGFATWAPVIGTAVSAVGGLINAGAQRDHEMSIAEAQSKPQVTTHTADLAKLRADAEANGFNALTVLRAGGLSAYGSTTSPPLMARATSPTSPVGQLFSGIGATFGAFTEVQRNKTEYDLAQAQIRNYDADSKLKSQMYRTPQYTAPRVTTSGGVPGKGVAATPIPGQSDRTARAPVGGEKTDWPKYRVFGYELLQNPWWTSAEDMETWHGDAADGFSPFRMNDDLIYNSDRIMQSLGSWGLENFGLTKIPEGERGSNGEFSIGVKGDKPLLSISISGSSDQPVRKVGPNAFSN